MQEGYDLYAVGRHGYGAFLAERVPMSSNECGGKMIDFAGFCKSNMA
jgi:hypothetical protein